MSELSFKELFHHDTKRNGINAGFLKGVQWSPEGTCALTSSDDRFIRLYSLPQETYLGNDSASISVISPVLTVREGETIYDLRWFSQMALGDTSTACFASSCKDHPIHLWDGFTGLLKCSYSPFNHLEQLDSAISLSFSSNGKYLHCGFANGIIRTFFVLRPGKDYNLLFKSSSEVLHRGLIGSICSNNQNSLIAVGSYSHTSAVFESENGECVCSFEGHKGGVTNVQFSPDGMILATGARKDNSIFCWDLRNFEQPLFILQRKVSTNQKITFDFTKDGKHLISGSQDGTLLVFDLEKNGELAKAIPPGNPHCDAINGINVHPYLPLIATTTGQRHHEVSDSLLDFSDDSDEEPTSTKQSQSQPQPQQSIEAMFRVLRILKK